MKCVSKDFNILRSFSISRHIELCSRDLPEAYSLTLGSAAEGKKNKRKIDEMFASTDSFKSSHVNKAIKMICRLKES